MSERIRKLAKKLDRSVDDVVAALASLGESRYRQADDLVPDALLGPLERALKKLPASRSAVAIPISQASAPRFSDMAGRGGRPEPLPSSIPDDPGLNAALQDYLSAAPLGELKKSLAEKKPGDKKQAPVPVQPSTEALLRDSLGAEIHRRRLAEDALGDLRQELARLQSARTDVLDETRAALVLSRNELAQVKAEAAQQLAALELRIETLTAELRAERQASEGLKGRVAALQLEAEQSRQVQEQLHAELQAELARRLALEDRLEARSEASLVPVAAASSKTDPGAGSLRPLFPSAPSAMPEQSSSSRDAAARGLLNACRERGITRINVVGGSPKYQQELKSLLPGIELRGVDGTSFMDKSRARQHVEGADLTIVWGGSILSHRVSTCYTDLKDPTVVVIHHRGMEGLLREATDFLCSGRFVGRD